MDKPLHELGGRPVALRDENANISALEGLAFVEHASWPFDDRCKKAIRIAIMPHLITGSTARYPIEGNRHPP